jgi:hypothetical protein
LYSMRALRQVSIPTTFIVIPITNAVDQAFLNHAKML